MDTFRRNFDNTSKKKIVISVILFGLYLCVLYSCTDRSSIDKIIERFDKVDFKPLQNTSVYYRSRGENNNSSIYVVNVFDQDSCSPYFVEFDKSQNKILNINDSLVWKSCGHNYLNHFEIETILREYLKYNLLLLQVDNDGNVYINPYKQDFPILLRKVPNSNPKYLKRYKKYKGNWYIRE